MIAVTKLFRNGRSSDCGALPRRWPSSRAFNVFVVQPWVANQSAHSGRPSSENQRSNELKAKREARGQDTSFNPFDLWFSDEGRPECADWFATHGWTTSTLNARDEGQRLGRAPESGDRPFLNSFVTAIKP